jgi:hypothetical protein
MFPRKKVDDYNKDMWTITSMKISVQIAKRKLLSQVNEVIHL